MDTYIGHREGCGICNFPYSSFIFLYYGTAAAYILIYLLSAFQKKKNHHLFHFLIPTHKKVDPQTLWHQNLDAPPNPRKSLGLTRTSIFQRDHPQGIISSTRTVM